MTRWLKGITSIGLVLLSAAAVAAAEESLPAARELYASAAYEDALMMLDRLRAAQHAPDENRSIEQYRAFCLLALGRAADAERAIEAVVAGDPGYQPSDSDVSPRLRTAFSDVRRRMLPGIIQEQYGRARAAFDARNWVVAAGTFKQMLDTLADPAVGPAALQPPLSDLKVLAIGFRDLSVAAAAPPPPMPPAPVVIAAAAPPPPPPVPPRVYGQQDADVQPPVIVRQQLPEYDARFGAPSGQAALEIVIDEQGRVEHALLRGSLHPRYDALALDAARSWRYKPASREGVPVKYVKLVAIAVKL